MPLYVTTVALEWPVHTIAGIRVLTSLREIQVISPSRMDLPPTSTVTTLIAMFIGPTWGPSGADRTQVGHMLAPWTWLSGYSSILLTPGVIFGVLISSQPRTITGIQRSHNTPVLGLVSYYWHMNAVSVSLLRNSSLITLLQSAPHNYFEQNKQNTRSTATDKYVAGNLFDSYIKSLKCKILDEMSVWKKNWGVLEERLCAIEARQISGECRYQPICDELCTCNFPGKHVQHAPFDIYIYHTISRWYHIASSKVTYNAEFISAIVTVLFSNRFATFCYNLLDHADLVESQCSTQHKILIAL